eukprot:1162083-Pelagomonas_calceolata.AAC.14
MDGKRLYRKLQELLSLKLKADMAMQPYLRIFKLVHIAVPNMIQRESNLHPPKSFPPGQRATKQLEKEEGKEKIGENKEKVTQYRTGRVHLCEAP